MISEIAITILVILGATILFVTEIISADLVALLIIVVLVVTGVITPQQGIDGFGNIATITIVFMFILSAAILKTGALQVLATRLSSVFRYSFTLGMLLMMLLIALMSAFINNTPVVAVFIPVVFQIAHSSGQYPSKILIPLSFASIFGGLCTLIGTSTNILVSGIAEKNGLEPLTMFQLTPIGLILMGAGVLYMVFIGIRFLPKKHVNKDLSEKFGIRKYVAEVEILENSESVGERIMDSSLVKEIGMDILEVRRNGARFVLPQGDFKLRAKDVLKVQCSIDKIKSVKDRAKIKVGSNFKFGDQNASSKNTSLIELVVTSDSEINGFTLKEIDFRRRYRAVPLAIMHREQVIHEQLYQTNLKAGDIILAEVKNHYVEDIKRKERESNAPFIVLSQNNLIDFKRKKFGMVMSVLLGVVLLSSLGTLNIMMSAILGVVILAVSNVISMKEAYEAISWKVIFLLVGALCLGTAISNTGLDNEIAQFLIHNLQDLGPIALISVIYLVTSLMTEVMSNTAAAALSAPIAISIAKNMELDPIPFIIAITIAASASFMTPIGYQTNTMVYFAGKYKFGDFIKVGGLLNLIFWILTSLLIPVLYGL